MPEDLHIPIRIAQLIRKSLDQTITPEEEVELGAWITLDPANTHLADRLLSEDYLREKLAQLTELDTGNSWEKLLKKKAEQQSSPKKLIIFPRWKQIAVAAVFIPVLGVGIWLAKSENRPSLAKDQTVLAVKDQHKLSGNVVPGAQSAVLIMADGAQIKLDSSGSQLLHEKDGTPIRHGKGTLAYSVSGESGNTPALINTLITPRGSTFHIVLPDGTIAWLNAQTSLRFPTRFSDTERRVELDGEAYFEVAKNAKAPFTLSTPADMEVKVLGTHFNVHAYATDKTVTTSLLEGKVQLQQRGTGGSCPVLAPGQQGILTTGTGALLVKDADVQQAVAWKDGIFAFDHTPMEEVLRILGRWYDVEVEFSKKEVKDKHFTGALRRQDNLEASLAMLELTGGAKFHLKNRTIYVTD